MRGNVKISTWQIFDDQSIEGSKIKKNVDVDVDVDVVVMER